MELANIKQEQRKNWNGLANAWGEWGDVFELGAVTVSNLLFEMAKLKQGDIVLDIATGIGEPALSAGQIVGENGKVVGIDIAEEMIEIAKKRGLHSRNVQFFAVDAASYEFKHTYDAVLSRFGFMFMPDYKSVLKKIHSSLGRDGSLAFSVWDTPDKSPMISLAVGFFARELNLPPPPKGLPSPFNMADLEKVVADLREAGFGKVSFRHVEVPFIFESVAHYMHFASDLIPASINKMIHEVSDEKTIKKLWDKFSEVVRKFETQNGAISLPSTAICFCASK